jgi:hypothetical protein
MFREEFLCVYWIVFDFECSRVIQVARGGNGISASCVAPHDLEVQGKSSRNGGKSIRDACLIYARQGIRRAKTSEVAEQHISYMERI